MSLSPAIFHGSELKFWSFCVAWPWKLPRSICNRPCVRVDTDEFLVSVHLDLTRDLSHAYDEGSWRVSSVRGTLRYDTGVDSGVAPANDEPTKSSVRTQDCTNAEFSPWISVCVYNAGFKWIYLKVTNIILGHIQSMHVC